MLDNYKKLGTGVIKQIEVSDIIIENDPSYYVNYYNSSNFGACIISYTFFLNCSP
jgi:hypothetical protein